MGLDMTPGNVQQLGEEQPGCAFTLIRFVDGSILRVYWVGGYEVAGLNGASRLVTIYCPPPPGRTGHRTINIPWHRIDMVDHQEREDT